MVIFYHILVVHFLVFHLFKQLDLAATSKEKTVGIYKELKIRVYYFISSSQKYCTVDAQHLSRVIWPPFCRER